MERLVLNSLLLAAVLALAGCGNSGDGANADSDLPGGPGVEAVDIGVEAPTELAVPSGRGTDPPDTLDATLGSGGEFLGMTIASLGDPNNSGLWVRSPLVSERTQGHVHYSVSSRTVRVELIPSGGATGSGSQVSLAVMRLLDAPLEGLLELAVYRS